MFMATFPQLVDGILAVSFLAVVVDVCLLVVVFLSCCWVLIVSSVVVFVVVVYSIVIQKAYYGQAEAETV